MKEATEFGIKYVKNLPDGSQNFVMHDRIWTDRKAAEQVVEALRNVVPCPMLVEIWEPTDIEILQDEITSGTSGKVKEPLPEAKEEQPEPKELTVNKRLEYTSHPDGTVTIKIDGKDTTDPEQQKQIYRQMDDMFKRIVGDQPWGDFDRLLGNDPRMFLWDPNQAPYYNTTGGWPNPSSISQTPKFKCEASNPAFKCECGD